MIDAYLTVANRIDKYSSTAEAAEEELHTITDND